MMADQKGFSIVFLFAVVTMLSCCSPASSFAFLPRVSRTNDAVIIDFAGVGYAPSYQAKTLYGQIAHPGFIPVPSLNPYPLPMFRQQQQSNGWAYSYEYPVTPEVEEGEQFGVKQALGQCGIGPAMPAARDLATERIAGGTAAKKNAWPFIVALKKADGSIFCSGSLLSNSKVLVAAQCLEKMSLFEMDSVTVLIGMHLTDKSDVPMTRRLSRVVLHEKYNAFTYDNDIAILSLENPVVLSRNVAPVCLPPASADPDQYVDQPAIILGWGAADKAKPPTSLQQAKVAISPISECKNDADFGKYVTDSTTCITSDKNDKFTCSEDVGGPVVILPPTGAWTIVGINSYTKSCATGGLKTRVSALRTWIDKYMV